MICLEKLIDISLKIFKKEFTRVLNINSDFRKFKLIEKGKKGTFSNLVALKELFCFTCMYNENEIEIYYDENQIHLEYLINNPNKGFLNETFSYLAYHEYCHSLFSKSTQILKNEWENQHSIIKSFKFFNWFIIARIFSEFFADFKSKELGCDKPNSYIQHALDWVKNKDIDFYHVMLLPSTMSYQLDPIDSGSWLSAMFNNLHRFYIWEEWSLLKPIFNSFDLDWLLDFFHFMFTLFQLLCKNHTSSTLTRDKLNSLFQFLDKQMFNSHDFLNEDFRKKMIKFV